ncbi:calcium-binding protein [Oscillatoria sp. FACHB-1407]|nr:calcium-binding protein [Oscillatoria sp. FACHB-1407]
MDTLNGDDGNDTLDGGLGGDNLRGGGGDDIYILDAGDNITEAGNSGTDVVRASITYNLGANLENLVLVGTDNINGSGNELSNTLTGNAGNNTLSGGGNIDSLNGGDGNDTLAGGAGNDDLRGDGGSDNFAFGTGNAFNSNALGVDRILDFVIGSDKIVLSKTTFTALLSTAGNGFNVPTEFESVADDATAALSAATIVLSRASGNLFYNTDGIIQGFGTGSSFATLTTANRAQLGATDFVIVA